MRERIRKRIRIRKIGCRENKGQGSGRIVRCVMYVSALLMCIALCGCTRKEQLVLEVEGTAEGAQTGTDAEDALRASEEQTPAGQQTPQGQMTAEQQMPQGQTAAGQQTLQEQSSAGQQMAEGQTTIFVHVCGAVRKPGVYELPAGSRVYEAVRGAGGFTDDADESYVNQAQTLTDGVKLVIPTVEQTEAVAPEGTATSEGTAAPGSTAGQIGIVEQKTTEQAGGSDAGGGQSAGQSSAADGRININTASEAELCTIPGIGATRAAAIVAYRQERGGFSSIEDIMNVSGIKEGTYTKIKDSIRVN